MKRSNRKFLSLASSALLAAACVVVGGPVRAEGGIAAGPITDTHIHFWDTKRGIPWPSPEFKKLYRDVSPADYKAVAKPLGITGSGVVEASNKFDDQFWVLDQVKGDDFFKFYVAMLEIGSDDFVEKLDKLSANKLVVGIRGFLWAPELKVDKKQIEHCKVLAKRGMTLDIISRGSLNPKKDVNKLAKAVPDLRIIIDHLAGAKGKVPDPQWVRDMQELAKNKNVYIKFSSFFDMYNPRDNEKESWTSPTDLAAYKPHFDVLFQAFGADRMIWGSNWPVVEMGGTLAEEIAIAEEYLAPMGKETRDKVMSKNALSFYTRKP
jgi:L-fucono-1,5-lactonase